MYKAPFHGTGKTSFLHSMQDFTPEASLFAGSTIVDASIYIVKLDG
jgi:hypothetical protein